ncbi:MAG: excinuclease ABC subunit UvrC [Treponema sp.]|jgi:excinuclease ABC subunit C|nr:excinuclease ABC subunit UvrC [Treponema sp.]
MDDPSPGGHLSALKKTAREAPLEPGVYIMRDGENRIIYVGKARVLRNRLGSYFAGGKDVKTAVLLRRARSIETIIVHNEYEALLLENTLIKQHFPKFNINLKDGKTYPVIRVTREDYPRIFRTRHIMEDGSLYFGPFPNVQAVDKMLELVDKLFPLRKCRTLKKRTSPCMYYHIGRCMAPCCGKIGPGVYTDHVARVRQLLEGDTDSLVGDLEKKMREAAEAMRFEGAARLRDAIRAIGDLSGPNSVVDSDPEGRDYIAWAFGGILATFTVFSMRGGKMTGRELFHTRSAAGEEESLETFAAAYYTPDRPPPPRIYIALPPGLHGDGASPADPGAPALPAALSRWFREQFGHEPELRSSAELAGDFPGAKRHGAILAMARQNALEDLRRRLRERGAGPALDELARVLGLKTRPERIEGFDIAQLDGKHPAASLISFKNGVPDRKNYRRFKLRTVVGKVDDFAAMREVVRRRYSRLIREGKELPDLVLVDGGIGQVNAARGVFDELGMDSGLVGLAKREEELWLPHAPKPVVLERRSEALKVLQHVRDETHRFATSFNQSLRSGDLLFPALESVKGIGPRRAAAIMRVYESIDGIAAAEVTELAARCGIGLTAAKAVRAAARLALENREAAARRLAAGRRGLYDTEDSRQARSERAASLAAEAAEAGRDYGGKP